MYISPASGRVLRLFPNPANQTLLTGASYRLVETSCNLDRYESPTLSRPTCGKGSKVKNDPSAVFLSLWTMTVAVLHHLDATLKILHGRKLHKTRQRGGGGGDVRRQTVKSKPESWREPQGSVCSLRRATNLSVPTCSAVIKHESVERR